MRLDNLSNKKKFILTAEISPPKGTNLDYIKQKGELLKNYVDAVNITDNQRSCMKMSGLAVAKTLKDMGIEPIYQLTCRDKNRIALQSDLLAASAFGIENVLLLSGDHTKKGDHPTAKPVFDLDTIQLLKTAHNLNKGFDMSNNKLNGSTNFALGAVVNPNIEPLELQTFTMLKKINAGATFFQTQVIFSPAPIEKLLLFLEKEGIKKNIIILGGVLLLKSIKMINFMNTIPGIKIPDFIIRRMSNSKNQLEEGMKICSELIKELKSILNGVHIMAMNSEELIPDIIKNI